MPLTGNGGENMEEMLKKYIPYIKNMAFGYSKRLFLLRIDIDDLYQEGCMKLIEICISCSDISSLSSSYLYKCINCAMLNYITRTSFEAKMPFFRNQEIRFMINKNNEYYQKYGEGAPNSFLAAAFKDKKFPKCEITEEDIILLKKLNLEFFKANILSYENLTEEDIISDDMEELVIDHQLIEEILEIVSNMSDRDQEIIKKRIGIKEDYSRTFREIAGDINISCQAVYKRYQKCLKEISNHLELK